jgi:hypothetical protein
MALQIEEDETRTQSVQWRGTALRDIHRIIKFWTGAEAEPARLQEKPSSSGLQMVSSADQSPPECLDHPGLYFRNGEVRHPLNYHELGGNYLVLDIGGGRYAFYARCIPVRSWSQPGTLSHFSVLVDSCRPPEGVLPGTKHRTG